MNFEWDVIAKELAKQKRAVTDFVKDNYKNFYKIVKRNELIISFVVLIVYWIHIKLNLKYSIIYSVAKDNNLFENYFELVFNNPNFKFFITKTQDLKFLKDKLPKIIADSCDDLILSIGKILDSYKSSVKIKNLKNFVKSAIYFFAINDNIKPFNLELRKTFNNFKDYNKNVDIFLYSLEVYKESRDAFAIIDRENLANITVAINRLTQYLVDK